MKLFKRLLAAALVGVLALTLMVGCSGNPNADDSIPTGQEVVFNAYKNLTDKASAAGCNSNVDYSRKLSTVAESMRVAINGVKYQVGGEYSADPDEAAKEAFRKAIDNGTLPKGSVLCVGYLPTNPAYVTDSGFEYKNFYTQPDFESANTVGIVYNGGQLMIIAARIPKTSK